MTFAITFTYRGDRIGAQVDGDKATVYWGKAPPRDKTLNRSWTYEEMVAFHPLDIQLGVFQVVGPEIQHITDLRFHKGEFDWVGHIGGRNATL